MSDAAHAELTPKLVSALYTEAMVLADEARSYFDQAARGDRMGLSPVDRVGFSCESLKVTTRLMHIIAWLLTQRAVAAGEISAAQGRDPKRLLGEGPDTDEALLPRLPEAAVTLIRATEDMFERIQRLENGLGLAAHSPARSLLNRLERSL